MCPGLSQHQPIFADTSVDTPTLSIHDAPGPGQGYRNELSLVVQGHWSSDLGKCGRNQGLLETARNTRLLEEKEKMKNRLEGKAEPEGN